MSSKAITPEPTGRRGSARLEAKKLAADLAGTPKPTREVDEKKNPAKKATPGKATSGEKVAGKATIGKKAAGNMAAAMAAAKAAAAPKSTSTKRKSPSPETDQLDGESEIGIEKSPSKKSKPNPKDNAAESKKADTKETPTPVTTQVIQSVRKALNPYLEILDPFMQFQMLCNNKTADTALGQEIEELRVTVLDLVRELQTEDNHDEDDGSARAFENEDA